MSETDDSSEDEVVYEGAVAPYMFEPMAVAGAGSVGTKDMGIPDVPSPSSGWYYSFVFLIIPLAHRISLFCREKRLKGLKYHSGWTYRWTKERLL